MQGIAMTQLKGPKFVQYFQPVLSALKALGSSATPKEVFEWIESSIQVPKSEIEEINKSGQSKFENKVHWARFYLAKAGYIETEKRGIWVLTDMGRKANLTHSVALKIFHNVRLEGNWNKEEQSETSTSDIDSAQASTSSNLVDENASPDDDLYINQKDIQDQLFEILQNLDDKGFEELSARLLRHLGFESVNVTGRTGDEGIDGEGYLRLNRFVRTKVMFQCKRYTAPVGPGAIRDFRGAIQGRAERGIFLTTANFTRAAKEAAARENATPIELVEIDDIITLLIEERLGVSETKALKLDLSFFKPYSRS